MATKQWDAAIEGTPEWITAGQALVRAQNLVLATPPATLAGIQALIGYARREHYLDDPSADQVLEVIERAIAGMIDRRP